LTQKWDFTTGVDRSKFILEDGNTNMSYYNYAMSYLFALKLCLDKSIFNKIISIRFPCSLKFNSLGMINIASP